jgi:hypothetical protein
MSTFNVDSSPSSLEKASILLLTLDSFLANKLFGTSNGCGWEESRIDIAKCKDTEWAGRRVSFFAEKFCPCDWVSRRLKVHTMEAESSNFGNSKTTL